MPTPSVSVVIPSYNHGRYLLDAIHSALAQSLTLEVIVQDDASTDNSWQVLQKLSDPRLRIGRNPQNLGAHATLQQLLSLATGEFLAILNSDDRFGPDRLAHCVARLQESKCDLIGSDIRLVDSKGKCLREHWWIDAFAQLKSVYRDTNDWVATLLEGNVFMTTSNFVFTRQLWEQHAPFSQHRYVHDYEFLLRILAAGAKLGWVDEPLLDYRLHGHNTIIDNPLQANLETSQLLRHFLPAFFAAQNGDTTRLKHLNSQLARIERYVQEILLAQQHDALVQKDKEWASLQRANEHHLACCKHQLSERERLFADQTNRIQAQEIRLQECTALMFEQQSLLAAQHSEIVALQHQVDTPDSFQWLKYQRRQLGRARQQLSHSARALMSLWRLKGAPVSRVDGYAALRRQIEALPCRPQVLSFDVFDTLLARCIEPPECIVRRVAEWLAQRLGMAEQTDWLLDTRRQVETKLRKRTQEAGGDNESHYDQILQGWLGLVAVHLNEERRLALLLELEQHELALERLALTAKPNTRLFLAWAKTAGFRVIAVSDMYLGERHVRSLLDDLGYQGLIERVYVSSEHDVGKYSGRLFSRVLEQEDIRPEQIVHIGDNFHSDGIAPSRLGIRSFFLDERRERERRRCQHHAYEFANRGGIWPGRMLAQVIAERLRHDSLAKHDAFFFQYGLEVLGPVFSCFLQGLLERIHRDKPERVFFLARDGELFMRMYETCRRQTAASLPPASYAYVSRRVVASAAVATGLDYDMALVGLANPKQRGLDSILKSYGLAAEPFAELAIKHGFVRIDERIEDRQDPRLKAFLDDQGVQEQIRAHGIEANQCLRDYFAQIGFFEHERVAMVDIGWNATIQRFMERAYVSEPNYPQVYGYYFALLQGLHKEPLRTGSIEGLILDQRRQYQCERSPCDFEELFEQGARALHATTVGYCRNEEQVTPVLKDENAPDRQAEIRCNPLVSELQQGVLLYLEHFLAARQLTGLGFDALKPYVLALAERAVVYPTPQEVTQISRLAHTEDFGHDHLLDLSAYHIKWHDFLRPQHLLQQLLNLPWRFAPFARFRTPLACTAARILHFRQLKRKKNAC